MANPSIQLGTNSNWAVKEDKLLAYKEYNDYFFNKEFDFSRGTSATYVAKDGLIASAASGVPRIDFTNDTKGHLLLEPSRTNLVTNSNNFSSYTFTNIDYNANNSISPDGSVNATKVTPNTSNAFHDLRTSANISLGSGNNTVSFFIKSNGYNFFELGVASNSGFSKYATAVINLNDGTNANTGVNQTWTITNVNISEFNSDWYRLELTFNVDTSTSTAMVFASSLPTSTRGVAFQGDGTSGAYIYGLQLEQGSYPTSLINTTGAASTRNADVCNNSGSAQDFNSEEGVLYAEIAALTDEDDYNRYISISDGTVSNSIMITYRLNGNLNLYNNGTGSSETIYGDSGYDLTDNLKIAVKYGASKSDYRVYINGVQKTVRTGFTATSISGLNTLRFEQGGSGNKFYGRASRIN
jgi:hypothetical protein